MGLGTASTRRPGGKIFYGWWIVVVAFVFQALSAGLLGQAFGAYFVHLQDEFGWSKAVLSGAVSLSQLEGGLLGPLQGWLIDRFGPRNVLRVGILFFGVGLFLLSQIDSQLAFYGAYLVASVGSGLAGFLTVNTAVANWFDRKRGLAMGLAATGWGAAGFMVPGVAWSLGEIGWRNTAMLSGVIALAIGLPVAQLMRHAPEPYGYAPDGAPPQKAEAEGRADEEPAAQQGFSLVEALRTRAFWMLAGGHATAWFLSSAVMVHLIPHLHEGANMSVAKAASIVTLLTVFQLVGQVGGGYLGDRIDKRIILVACMGGHVLGLLALVFANGLPLVIVFAALHGTAWGARGSLMTAVRADYFGRRSFATVTGMSSLIVTTGGVAGPVFAGLMADHFGSYEIGFIILAVVAAAGTLFYVFAKRPAPPARVRQAMALRAQP